MDDKTVTALIYQNRQQVSIDALFVQTLSGKVVHGALESTYVACEAVSERYYAAQRRESGRTRGFGTFVPLPDGSPAATKLRRTADENASDYDLMVQYQQGLQLLVARLAQIATGIFALQSTVESVVREVPNYAMKQDGVVMIGSTPVGLCLAVTYIRGQWVPKPEWHVPVADTVANTRAWLHRASFRVPAGYDLEALNMPDSEELRTRFADQLNLGIISLLS